LFRNFTLAADQTKNMRAKILNASAGSGKTYQLAYKYVRDVVGQPSLYRHILAVTFTNKATEEMKSRILKEIHLLASGAGSSYLEKLCAELHQDRAAVRKRAAEVQAKILHDYSRFTVLTIDTFFQRILRAFIKELGIDLNYNVEIETASVLAKSADTLIEEITADGELLRWMTEFIEERIDEGRKWDVREGILALGGELFKERNRQTLAAPHPKEELREFVRQASARAETTRRRMREAAAKGVALMDAAGLSPADFSGRSRSFAHYFQTVAAGELKAPSDTVLKRARSTDGWCAARSPAEAVVPQLQPLLLEMCTLYEENIRSWNTCDLVRENYRSFALLSDLYARVQELCDRQNTMLLSETKYILSEFIGRNDAPFIYEKAGNRFERFMIDEFQDTSVREWENFLPLLRNAMAQSDETSVLLVGDIKQSIYRWRGGDWRILHEEAQRQLGSESTCTEALRDNWRSLREIVAFNNRTIGRIVEADNRTLNEGVAAAAARGDIGVREAEQLHDTLRNAYRSHEQVPRRRADRPGYVSVETFAGRPPVVERICELLDRGFRPSDIMILVRGATDGARVAAELLDFKKRNTDPRHRFDVMTQEALLVGKAPVASFLTAALQLAVDPDDSLARASYNHFLGRAFDAPLTPQQRDFFRSIRLLTPEEAFERIVLEHELQHDHMQTAYLQAVHEQIIAFCNNKVADIPLFLAWWKEQGSRRSLSVDRSQTAVEITTIHKAKGLERPAVIIPYCSWQLGPKTGGGVQQIVWAEASQQAASLGAFPVRYRKAMAESEFSAAYFREWVLSHVDNINLLYVALTRAAESLHVFVPQQGGRHVGTLLLESLEADRTAAEVAEAAETEAPDTRDENREESCRYTAADTGERYEYGEFRGPVNEGRQEEGPQHVVLEGYPTTRPDLRLRLPSQRYFEEEPEAAPRDRGILLHRVFENATGRADIERAVRGMELDGILSAGEAAELRAAVDRALDDPRVSEWFGDGWQRVLNEHEIILPGQASSRRPDRVMIGGGRAVVVDYKFGAKDSGRHRRQIAEYLALLRAMGYARVEGYLWYVRMGRIEKVECDEGND